VVVYWDRKSALRLCAPAPKFLDELQTESDTNGTSFHVESSLRVHVSGLPKWKSDGSLVASDAFAIYVEPRASLEPLTKFDGAGTHGGLGSSSRTSIRPAVRH
jgi:hypothetical protein